MGQVHADDQPITPGPDDTASRLGPPSALCNEDDLRRRTVQLPFTHSPF